MVKTIFSPRVKNIPPQWLSKCSQWTSRISITWELVKILRSIKHKKKNKKETMGVESGDLYCNSPPGEPD